MLLLILAAAVAMEAAPFSHQLHLQLKLDCLSCHAGVTESTKAADNNLPAPAICARCHTGKNEKPVRAQASPTRLSAFNHALHLKLGNAAPVIAAAIARKTYHTSSSGSHPLDKIRTYLSAAGGNACAGCHRGLEDSEAAAHSDYPQMADCLVCHPQIDPPFSCEKCHAPIQAFLKPPSHTANYIDVHSSGKANLDKPSCVICHGQRFQCMGCH